jgi:hypothetical protein
MFVSSLQALLTAGIVNENPTHGFCGGEKEMRATLPGLVLVTQQAQICLMNQGRRL